MSDTLVPEPQASIFDSVAKALGNDEPRRVASCLTQISPKDSRTANQWKSNTKTPSRTLVAAAIRLEHAVVPKNRMTASR